MHLFSAMELQIDTYLVCLLRFVTGVPSTLGVKKLVYLVYSSVI